MRDGLSTTEATAPTPQATAADAEPLARAVRDVLIADPDPVTQTVLQIVLRQRGYRTRSVLTAAEAIEALERHPGAVVTELVFPDRRGPDVVHAARSLSRETVVLVLSEISADGAVVEALKAGAHDYVRKPFSPEELIARLERHATPD